MTEVFYAQLPVTFARSGACRVGTHDFIIVMCEAWLQTGLCMDDVVERVAQHGLADVLWIYSIVHAVTLHLYLCLKIVECQIDDVSPVAVVAGLVLVTAEGVVPSGCRFDVVDDNGYLIILAENGGARQILQFERHRVVGTAFTLGTLTGLVINRRRLSIVT